MLQRDVSLMQTLDHDTERCIANQIATLTQSIDCASIRTGIDAASEFHQLTLFSEVTFDQSTSIDNWH